MNEKNGYGTSKFASGGKYQGQWKMGAEEGNGKRLYPDGCVWRVLGSETPTLIPVTLTLFFL